jgi:hypothetical protein
LLKVLGLFLPFLLFLPLSSLLLFAAARKRRCGPKERWRDTRAQTDARTRKWGLEEKRGVMASVFFFVSPADKARAKRQQATHKLSKKRRGCTCSVNTYAEFCSKSLRPNTLVA